jgi:hypothetical protein
MDATTIGLLATAISAPICAAILKLVPQRGVKYDGPPTESIMTKEICIAHRNGIEARLTRVENSVFYIETKVFPTQKKDPTP